ncbi:MAG: cytochrome P450 [Actinomycetota bacterium]|nr:cytochrome P450 [Actinomycetota bacterium]
MLAGPASSIIEVREELATPIPLLLICKMLGIPEADAARLRHLTEAFNGGFGTSPARMRVAHAAIRELEAYLEPLIEDRRSSPGDDLLSLLAEGEQIGAYATHQELCANIVMLVDSGA